ncbi:FliO/MopB family protein [Thalassiella azotivora]
METLGLVLRVGLSLACVLGLVWLFSKGALKGGLGTRPSARGRVQLLARQQLSRSGSVAVVQVGGRALVLGVTEQQVTLLTETDLDAVVAPEPSEARDDVTASLVAAVPTSTDAADTPPAAHGTVTDPAASSDPAPSAGPSAVPAPRTPSAPSSALAGSALSPATWAQAVEVLREKTTRR